MVTDSLHQRRAQTGLEPGLLCYMVHGTNPLPSRGQINLSVKLQHETLRRDLVSLSIISFSGFPDSVVTSKYLY